MSINTHSSPTPRDLVVETFSILTETLLTNRVGYIDRGGARGGEIIPPGAAWVGRSIDELWTSSDTNLLHFEVDNPFGVSMNNDLVRLFVSGPNIDFSGGWAEQTGGGQGSWNFAVSIPELLIPDTIYECVVMARGGFRGFT